MLNVEHSEMAIMPPPAAPTPMSIVQAAMASGNVEMYREAVALAKEMDQIGARKAFDNAMAAAKASITVIRKNRRVAFDGRRSGAARTDYAYEDLAEIARTVDPALSAHGLSYRFRVSSDVNQPVRVTCIIAHRDGHSEETTLQAGRDDSGNKNSIQAIGSAITYLQRYTLKAALGLAAAQDDDGNATEPEDVKDVQQSGTISRAQVEQIRMLLTENNLAQRAFLQFVRLARIEDIGVENFDRAVAAIKKAGEEVVNIETINDRTDHNRLAEQFAMRIRAESDLTSKPQAATKRTRRSDRPASAVEPEPAEQPVTRGNVEIVNCEQNSPEWLRARMGIPTASSFSDVMAKGEGKTRRSYMLKLAGEIITGEPMENFSTVHTDRGHQMEAEARDLYVFQVGAELDRIGFVRNGRVGCSPDALIGSDGGLEIKTKLPHLLIDLILKDEFPAEHKAQVQGALWITERAWWDIAIYWPGIPLFVKRIERDEAYIKQIASEVDRFNADLDAVVAQMRNRIEAMESNSFAAMAVAA